MRSENSTFGQHADYQQTYSSAIQQVVQPTAAQEKRRTELRRFNRLVITVPVSLTALAWLLSILGLIWLSIAGEWFAIDTNQTHYRELLSGVADVVTMLLLMPLLLLCALPIVGAVALVVYRKRKKDDSTPSEPSLPLFWRIENKVVMVHDAVARATPKLAKPVINAHSMVSFIKRLVLEVKLFITQEIGRNDDNR